MCVVAVIPSVVEFFLPERLLVFRDECVDLFVEMCDLWVVMVSASDGVALIDEKKYVVWEWIVAGANDAFGNEQFVCVDNSLGDDFCCLVYVDSVSCVRGGVVDVSSEVVPVSFFEVG